MKYNKTRTRIIFFSIIILLIFIVVYFKNQNKTKTINDKEKSGVTEIAKEPYYQYYYNYDKNFGNNYYYKDNLVYYMEKLDKSSPIIREMTFADKKTFEVLDPTYSPEKDNVYFIPTGLARDANYIYRYGIIVKELDAKSFEILGNRYVKTKDGIFVIPSLPTDMIRKLELADVPSFQVIKFKNNENYTNSKYDAKDKRYYYKIGLLVEQSNYDIKR